MAKESGEGETRADGRRLRGEDNRRRIVEALIALMRRGTVSPTAEEVAAKAGVGLRTVFRHFDDMEQLYREIGAAIEGPVRQIAAQAFTSQHWRGRLDEMTARRAEIYERIAPFMAASAANVHRSAYLRGRQRWFAREQRRLLVDVVPEIAALAPARLDALDLLLSFEAWQGLRHARRLDPAAARAAIAAGIDALTLGLPS